MRNLYETSTMRQQPPKINIVKDDFIKDDVHARIQKITVGKARDIKWFASRIPKVGEGLPQWPHCNPPQQNG